MARDFPFLRFLAAVLAAWAILRSSAAVATLVKAELSSGSLQLRLIPRQVVRP